MKSGLRIDTLKVPRCMKPGEGHKLCELACGLDVEGPIVEIGALFGASTIHLAASGREVISIDPHEGDIDIVQFGPTYDRFMRNIKRAGVDHLVIPMRMTSEEASRSFVGDIAMLFIDGLHDYEHVSQDWDLWTPLVVSGGLVVMHDAYNFAAHCDGAREVAERLCEPAYDNVGKFKTLKWGTRC